jgi:hypothetical protein
MLAVPANRMLAVPELPLQNFPVIMSDMLQLVAT